jgi:drug/metabolite transporter (DMT)-like permease
MLHIISLGILAAAFFSSTFVLNRAMSLQGGHWLWAACLRYLFMLLFLLGGLLLSGRGHKIGEIFRLFMRHWRFWILAGTCGFGFFYALICFSASYAPGWVIATSWQTTILATPLILLLFGKKTPTRALLFIGLIFAGILLVNLEFAQTASVAQFLAGALPVLGAAFAYPLGNQLVWEAQKGRHKWIPVINDPVLNHPFSRIILLSLGSVPFWLLLLLIVQPAAPSTAQWLQTGLVALFSGIIATSLFLHARQLAENSYELSAIDATQSTEVLFSLLGEVLLLGGIMPGKLGLVGVLMVIGGLVFYIKAQYQPADN